MKVVVVDRSGLSNTSKSKPAGKVAIADFYKKHPTAAETADIVAFVDGNLVKTFKSPLNLGQTHTAVRAAYTG